MAWCARLVAALLLTFVVAVGGAAAHQGGSTYTVITADYILPRAPFEVVASDMGPDASVGMRIVHEQTVAPLGTVRAAPDGHFVTNPVLPSDFPIGYAELFATAVNGASVSTWALVGKRTASTPPPPGTGSWWTDPSVVVLLVFLVGAVGAVGYLLLRPRAHRLRKRDRRPET